MAAFLLCGGKREVSAARAKYLIAGAGQVSSFSGAFYDSGITLRINLKPAGTDGSRERGPPPLREATADRQGRGGRKENR